ncbi:MAG TPA: MGMT family protein [Anaerolineae bacterium]|nr:MGMT family protein [Anaerolineae bacterium]HOR00870.1 MGMT family protein [Anaerolineae bacterium]HPL28162.1 MGMT family protein [Anaerolineae bacterium]
MNDDFFGRVYELVAAIPPGRIMTYGDIALRLGRPHGGRTVGWAMRHCPAGLPWYRVVNSRGASSVAARLPDGTPMQQALLEEEGVVFDATGRLDLARYSWTGAPDA